MEEKHHTEETKQKLRELRTGKNNSKESNEKNRISNTGKKMPPRTQKWMDNQSKFMREGGSRKANIERHDGITDEKDFSNLELYAKIVWKYTTISSREKYTREELKQRGRKKELGHKQLDHRFSIIKGFKSGILPCIIGSKSNISLVPCDYNQSKNSKCDITLEELFKKYEKEGLK